LDDIHAIHKRVIHEQGGTLAVLNPGLLESAVAQPQATMFGQLLHPEIYDQAAAYLFHIARNHSLVDGNKRVAGEAARIFLSRNGFELLASRAEYEHFCMEVAEGHADKEKIAGFFRAHTR